MPKNNTKAIDELLTRAVEHIYPSADLFRATIEKKKLTIYHGIDPTAPTLHIGHGVVLKKLRDFQRLGHKIILLIGDFTAQIGDPTDKLAVRRVLTSEQVLENCKNYKKQIGKILNLKITEFRYNSEWLEKLNLAEILKLASEITVQRMLERDMFEKRLYGEMQCPECKNFSSAKNIIEFNENDQPSVAYGEQLTCLKCHHKYDPLKVDFRSPKPIYLHEFFYPLMQGYDSVAMDVDMEIGGNDQTFNMLVGRDMMKRRGKEKFVMTMKLLADPTGKKMGKTEGNMITLEDAPEEMYGKVMAWGDGMIIGGFALCTDVPMEEVQAVEKELKRGKTNPRDVKMRLAREIVALYHGAAEAKKAEATFVQTFQKHETPTEISNFQFPISKISVVDALVETKLVTSKGEARRVIEQGGVKVDGKVIDDAQAIIKLSKKGVLVQKGKRHFVRVEN